MRVIHHQHHIVPAGDRIDLIQRRQITIHAENAIGDDQRTTISALVLENHLLQVSCIGMLIAVNTRTGKPAAIDDAGMVQGIRNNEVFLANQHGDHRSVGAKTGLKDNRSLDSLEIRQAALQFRMDVHGTGDRTHRARANTEFLQCSGSGFNQPGMIRQSEVIIRAEV